tara:strand:+ start:8171 stop:8368 length:198 start_codon:yes stop_codon:yes gene_type:complete
LNGFLTLYSPIFKVSFEVSHMKNILVFGSGCTKCKKTAEAIEKMAGELDIKAIVTKETSPQVMKS